jgi:hypothetical protein
VYPFNVMTAHISDAQRFGMMTRRGRRSAFWRAPRGDSRCYHMEPAGPRDGEWFNVKADRAAMCDQRVRRVRWRAEVDA